MTVKTPISPSLKWVILSQSTLNLGTSVVFPFYLIFIKEIGGGFTEFGIAYGLFSMFSVYLTRRCGASSERYARKSFLLAGVWGTSFMLLLIPVVSSIWQVYVLQIALGTFDAMQKSWKKVFIAGIAEREVGGEMMGRYHFGGSLISGAAVIAGGVLADFFTVDLIFYFGSLVLFFSGFTLSRVKGI